MPVDIERVAAEHPDLADELRELWAVAALAEEFGSQSAASDDGAEQASQKSRRLRIGSAVAVRLSATTSCSKSSAAAAWASSIARIRRASTASSR